MNTLERQALLSAFKSRETTKTIIHCAASGIALEINAPSFAGKPADLLFSAMSPFACPDTCMHLAKQRYSESHCKMAPTVLAGILIVLLDHYELRKDKLSTTEANLILSRVPPFELSQALSFLSELPKLSTHKRNSIPAISLSGLDYRTLSIWRISALTAINTFTSTPETTRVKRITKTSGKLIQDASIDDITRKAIKGLIKELECNDIINKKLATILKVVSQGNNLIMITPVLRGNLIAALQKLGTGDCLELAGMIKSAGQSLTYQEKAIATDLGSGEITNFPPTLQASPKAEGESASTIESDNDTPTKPMSLLERIKASKKQQQRESAAAFIAMAKEAAEEIEEAEVEEDAEGTSLCSEHIEASIEEVNDEEYADDELEADEEETDMEEIEASELREELDFSDSFMRVFDETIDTKELPA